MPAIAGHDELARLVGQQVGLVRELDAELAVLGLALGGDPLVVDRSLGQHDAAGEQRTRDDRYDDHEHGQRSQCDFHCEIRCRRERRGLASRRLSPVIGRSVLLTTSLVSSSPG